MVETDAHICNPSQLWTFCFTCVHVCIYLCVYVCMCNPEDISVLWIYGCLIQHDNFTANSTWTVSSVALY